MIIVEGPDGAGKSTLVQILADEFSLPVHDRAVGSDQKLLVPDLFEWAHRDVVTMLDQPLSVYDRHCLISEYVYGPICRGALPPGFTTANAHALVRMMASRVLVVLCRPSNERLRSSVSASRDTDDVSTHIDRIAVSYDALRIFWPGQLVTHDYASEESLSRVLSRCRIHVATENASRSVGR